MNTSKIQTNDTSLPALCEFGQAFSRTTSLLLAASPAIRMLGNTLGLTNFEMEILRGNVGYFKERGGTIGWLIEDDGIVVVDTQFQ